MRRMCFIRVEFDTEHDSLRVQTCRVDKLFRFGHFRFVFVHAHRHHARRFNLSTSARNMARKGRITKKFKDVDPMFTYFSSFVSVIINDIKILRS